MGTTGFLPGVLFSGDTRELPGKEKPFESSCNQDAQIQVDDDVTSTMSESSSGIDGLDRLLSCNTSQHQTSGRKAVHGHESDVDSGIVSCQLMDNHTASISSAETDSSRESSSNEQKWTLPSAPASDSTQCVRFDEQLHLSEENIRRSCRKLFATLYSHRFSYPCYSDSGILRKVCDTVSAEKEEILKAVESDVSRSTKLVAHPRLDIARAGNVVSQLESRRHHFRRNQLMENTSVANTTGGTNGNGGRNIIISVCENAQKTTKPVYWRRSDGNIVHVSSKLTSDFKERTSEEKTESTPCGTGEGNGPRSSETNFCRTRKAYFTKEHSNHRRLSVDQRLVPPPPPPVSTNGSESQNRNSLHPVTPFTHHLNNSSGLLNNNLQNNKSLMHKSLSCTVLPTCGNLSLSLIPYDKQDPAFPRRTSDPISVSSLNISNDRSSHGLERTPHHIPQATARSSMVRAYARVVPVVSDDSCSYTRTNLTLKTQDESMNAHNGALAKKHISHPVTPNNTLPTHSKTTKLKSTTAETAVTGNGVGLGRTISSSAQKSLSYKDLNYYKRSEEFGENVSTPQKGRSYARGRNSCMMYSHPDFSEVINNKYSSHRAPSNEGIPTSSRENVYAYKSLTSNHFKTNGSRKSSKIVNEVLDQSKKNRFNSLPVLDNLVSVDNKSATLPTNSKRGIHQSDFTLFRSQPSASSSSTGKSFLDRIQGFTRSAKNAVQKAFSTERIYRPEREERYEAEGQKLKRSHSFIRGLKERMSKKKRRENKKKKLKPPVVQQAVAQERLNTSWDEPIVGPGTTAHVEGQLLQLNPDGSQVIELTKPPSKPYGFFVARGRIRNSRGVFVSRMRDQETELHLTGLLGIGDEILEIESLNVKHADILQVNSLMAQRNSLILTVLPYVCRRD